MGAGLCGDAKPPPPPPPPLNPNKTRPAKAIVKSPERVAVRTPKKVNEEDDNDKGGGVTLKECLVKPPNNNLAQHATNPIKLQVEDVKPQQSQATTLPEVQSIKFHSPKSDTLSENATGKPDKVDGKDDDEKKVTPHPEDGRRGIRPKTQRTPGKSRMQDSNREPLLRNPAPQVLSSNRGGEKNDNGGLINSILKRDGSQKLDKAVSFHENDIFFVYSPITFLEES